MAEYDIYVFILCLIVFILLTASSVLCISIIAKLSLKLINSGVEDEKILNDYKKNKHKRAKSRIVNILDYTLSGIVCLAMAAMLAGALMIRFNENSCCGNIPTYHVVKSSSMSYKNEVNTYLFENNINDQFQRFDLIKTEKLPDEMELELYDVVVYEADDMLIIHRIVNIEEPNEKHPDCRYFVLQGDATDRPDRIPVYYHQMRALYTGERTPYIGSFIMFMQSPAGWICTLLVVVAMFAAPWLDRKLENARAQRLVICLTPTAVAPKEEEPVLMGGAKND